MTMKTIISTSPKTASGSTCTAHGKMKTASTSNMTNSRAKT